LLKFYDIYDLAYCVDAQSKAGALLE